jgi:hypothetical protein
MDVNITVTVKGVEYDVYGSCNFYGPYAESEGAIIEDIYPATDDPAVISEALISVEQEAGELYMESRTSSTTAHYEDLDNDYDNDYYSSGPDYWIDRDSGEYRCG